MFGCLYRLMMTAVVVLFLGTTCAIVTKAETPIGEPEAHIKHVKTPKVKKSEEARPVDENAEVQLLPLNESELSDYSSVPDNELLEFGRVTKSGCVSVIYSVRKLSFDKARIESYTPKFDLVCMKKTTNVSIDREH
jgi:hypothetical protein